MHKSSEIRRYVLWLCFALGLIHIGPVDFMTSLIVERHESQMARVDEIEWAEFHEDAYAEHVEAFDALFNSYETKWSKNNRLMMRQGSSGSYRFVAKA